MRWIYIFALFFLFPSFCISQTSTNLLEQAAQLSADRQYRTSNQLLNEYVRKNPNRLYDKSEAYYLKAQNFMHLGRSTEAKDFNEKSRAIREQLGTDDFVQNIALEGEIYLSEGNYEKGMNALFRAEQLPSEDPIFFSSIYRNIGKGFLSVAAYKKAADYFKKAIEILEVEGSEQPEEAALNYYYLAKAEHLAEHPAFSKIALRNALRVTRGLELSIHGHIYYLLAKLSKGEESILFFDEADALFQKFYGPHNKYSAQSIAGLMDYHFQNEDFDAASMALHKAKDRLNPAMAEGMEEAYALLDYGIMAKLLLRETQIAIKQSKGNNENLVKTLKTATGQLKAATDLVIMEQWLSPKKAPNREVFDLAVSVEEQLYTILLDKSYIETAFNFAQIAKTVDLRQSSLPQLFPVWEDQSPESWNVFMDWREAVLSYRAKPGSTDDLAKAYKAWEATNMEASKNKIEQMLFGESFQKLVNVQSALSNTDQLAVYHTGKNNTYLFSITNNSIELSTIAPSTDITEQKNSRTIHLYPSISHFNNAIKNNNRSAFEEYASHLYQQLVKPMSGTLTGKNNLIIVADGKIGELPFDALIRSSKKRKRRSLRKLDFLVKHHNISYLLSVDQLLQTKQAYTNKQWILTAPFTSERNVVIDYAHLFDTTYQLASNWHRIGKNDLQIPANGHSTALIETMGNLTSVQLINEIEALTKALESASIWQIESQSLTHPSAPALASIMVSDEFEEAWPIFVNEFVQKENDLSLIIFNSLSSPKEQFLLPLLSFSTGHILHPVEQEQQLFLQKLHEIIGTTKDIKTAIRNSKLEMIKKNKTAQPKKWAGMFLYGK